MRPLLFIFLCFVLRASSYASASALPPEFAVGEAQIAFAPAGADQPRNVVEQSIKTPPRLRMLLNALEVMQDKYFEVFIGTWPTAIDWTAAVLGTHISATLSSLVSSLKAQDLSCSDRLAWENTIAKYFAQTSIFYFGENAFGLRNQAYDDMLWVVLGWLESIKFMKMYSLGFWQATSGSEAVGGWHGMQFSLAAAHRARIFYDLASHGWTTDLCGGGMNWNPALTPYKNAITNELFISASISMYLYFPGDNNTSPYIINDFQGGDFGKAHDHVYLKNSIEAYKWLRDSKMQGSDGLYQDGFHISGWRKYPNGTIDPGSRECDVLNPMVYTYNQGVLLTASRGLWIATGSRSYLDEGHTLVDSVISATGWPDHDRRWHGLGRGGILEEFCDHSGYCSQDGQTFKGIFFHHLSEFCRPLWGFEEDFMNEQNDGGLDQDVYQYHMARCSAYGAWIAHNADAASVTRNSDGLFGMWWGREYPDAEPTDVIAHQTHLPRGAVDHKNGMNISSDLSVPNGNFHDVNDRGRGRSVETQSGGIAVLRADWQWRSLLPKY